VRRTYPLGWTP
jgi:hypothetical protein